MRLRKEFINEIETDEKCINNEIFWKYFKYQLPLFLLKDLFKVKNYKLVNHIIDVLIDLRNTIIIEAISENENPNKMVNVIENILNFDKQ